MKEGILIFTDEKTLDHKLSDGFSEHDDYCYWATMKVPKKFVETLNLSKSPRVAYGTSPYELIKEFPIYFAIKGKIVGYFVIHDVEEGDVDNEGTGESRVWLLFHSETWKDIKHGETLKPSQGWRYYPKKDAQHSKGVGK